MSAIPSASQLFLAETAWENPGKVTASPSATTGKMENCGGQPQRWNSANAPPRKNSAMNPKIKIRRNTANPGLGARRRSLPAIATAT